MLWNFRLWKRESTLFLSLRNWKFELVSCFSTICREHLKVGTGVACYSESSRNAGQVMEAVIVISQLSESTSPSCFQVCDRKTEVRFIYLSTYRVCGYIRKKTCYFCSFYQILAIYTCYDVYLQNLRKDGRKLNVLHYSKLWVSCQCLFCYCYNTLFALV